MSVAIDKYLGKKVAEDGNDANAITEAQHLVNDAVVALSKAASIVSSISGLNDISYRIINTKTIVNDLWKKVASTASEIRKIGR